MMTSLLWGLLLIYALWPLYVFSMAMMLARANGKTNIIAWILAFPIVLAAVTLDIVLNYTLFALLLWDFPRTGEFTFSQRLSRLIHDGGWRAKVSRWLVETLLDPYDPTGRHIK